MSKQPRFPSFWQLQILGWTGFYVLVLAASAPFLKEPGTLSDSTLFVVTLFLGSWLLRIVCRSLLTREISWLVMEAWVFVWCLVVGLVGAIIPELIVAGVKGVNWPQLLVNTLQYLVVLVLWCNLYFSVKQWRRSVEEKERLLRAEAEAREARLSALRYQLNPHFLFNSLNAVSTLVLEGNSAAATRMLSQIGDLLRTTLDRDIAPEVPLADEVAFAEQYLAIEKTRLGSRLTVDIAIEPATLNARVPNMLLQPLVENAVRHGIAPLVEGGMIAIRSEQSNSHLRIVVKDSGSGRRDGQKNENGIGLSNIAERLKILYGKEHKFALDWPDSGGCEVTVELPFSS